VIRVRLLLGAYAPLFVLLAIRFDGLYLRLACLLLAALGAAGLAALLLAQRREEPSPYRLERVTDEGSQVAAYMATYLLPFLTVPEPSVRDLLAYGAFLILVGWVLSDTDNLLLNPTLRLMGYRVFRVDAGSGWSGFALADVRLRSNIDVHGVLAATDCIRVTRVMDEDHA
jgi:hypothetical protein